LAVLLACKLHFNKVMKIAITYWNDRVSPLFDTASQLMVFEIKNNRETACVKSVLENNDPITRAKHLSQLDIDIVICGAISWECKAMLASVNIKVISCICGPVKDVLRACLNEKLEKSSFFMPGCKNHRRHNRARYGQKR